MSINSSIAGLVMAASLAMVGQLWAEVKVSFKATINESPFLTSGYTVGSEITGWYTYDPAVAPFDLGANYAMYSILEMNLAFGSAAYQATGGGRLNVVHFLPEITPNATDLYDLLGFTLVGPSVEGFSSAYAEVKLIDLDNSVYASTWPLPIDLPDPGLFEIQELSIGFLQGLPPTGRVIQAQIDSISILDSEPPTIVSVTATPNTLWPPNGQMVTVQIEVIAEDNVEVTSSRIVEVTSNEPACEKGHAETAPDWEILADLTLELRAERCGAGDGRVYTIVVQCADAAGNTSLGQVEVSTPHSVKPRR